jgi:hypothetical protein
MSRILDSLRVCILLRIGKAGSPIVVDRSAAIATKFLQGFTFELCNPPDERCAIQAYICSLLFVGRPMRTRMALSICHQGTFECYHRGPRGDSTSETASKFIGQLLQRKESGFTSTSDRLPIPRSLCYLMLARDCDLVVSSLCLLVMRACSPERVHAVC